MTKYRLKKDTPLHRAGEIFTKTETTMVASDKYETDTDLIINFDEWFEEIKEPSWWKPKSDEKYYFLSNVGEVIDEPWLGNWADKFRYLVGNCFKTKEAAERYMNYLKAITTLRQDEGVLTPEQVVKNDYVYYICIRKEFGPVVYGSYFADGISVGTVFFDTKEHAQDSRDKHRDEWKTIANYDWSKE